MSRYRKIDVRIHGDDRFRSLTKPQPNGQSMWWFLLTNKRTSNIPGLYEMGQAALAEELGWSPTESRTVWSEVSRAGLAVADWEARVIWVPNAIRYNMPENPSVVVGWGKWWDEIPECALKQQAWDVLRAVLSDIKKKDGTPSCAFVEAFEAVCRRPVLGAARQGVGEGVAQSPPHQEQEQEQEQEQDINPPSPPSADAASPPSAPGVALAVVGDRPLGKPRPVSPHAADIAAAYAHWRESHPQAAASIKTTSDGFKKAAARLGEGRTLVDLRAAIDGMHATAWYVENNQTAFEMAMRPDKFLMFLENNTAPPRVLTDKDRVMQQAYRRAASGEPGMFDGV